VQQGALNKPPIHDISTDTDDPPPFVAVAPLRKDARNAVEYGGPEVAAQQRKAYPDIAPASLSLPPGQAFARAEEAARAQGWEIVAVVPAEGPHRGHRHYAVVRLQGRRGDTGPPAGGGQPDRRALGEPRGARRRRHERAADPRVPEGPALKGGTIL
jgi:hypothetical protein